MPARPASDWANRATAATPVAVRPMARGRFTGRNVVSPGKTQLMASYSVNDAAVEHARKLIAARQYVLDSDWGEVQPKADAENAFLESHSWEEYGEWHLA